MIYKFDNGWCALSHHAILKNIIKKTIVVELRKVITPLSPVKNKTYLWKGTFDENFTIILSL